MHSCEWSSHTFQNCWERTRDVALGLEITCWVWIEDLWYCMNPKQDSKFCQLEFSVSLSSIINAYGHMKCVLASCHRILELWNAPGYILIYGCLGVDGPFYVNFPTRQESTYTSQWWGWRKTFNTVSYSWVIDTVIVDIEQSLAQLGETKTHICLFIL